MFILLIIYSNFRAITTLGVVRDMIFGSAHIFFDHFIRDLPQLACGYSTRHRKSYDLHSIYVMYALLGDNNLDKSPPTSMRTL